MGHEDEIWRRAVDTSPLNLGAAAELFPTSALTAPSQPNALASVLSAGANRYASAASDLFGLARQTTKRKVYFAFRFKDIMRVNNVRQSGKIGYDEQKNPRFFYDRSIWEQSERRDPESLKRLMREGVEHSSVVCVLTGSDTYDTQTELYHVS
jgi:antiphage defense system Thoeris ThsB-like protein